MNKPEFIVSLAGPPELHARADAYNRRRSVLGDIEADLRRAQAWNSRERFSSGWFSQTKPPLETSSLTSTFDGLIRELTAERTEIVHLSGDSVSPK